MSKQSLFRKIVFTLIKFIFTSVSSIMYKIVAESSFHVVWLNTYTKKEMDRNVGSEKER